jgi:hypothetical protein
MAQLSEEKMCFDKYFLLRDTLKICVMVAERLTDVRVWQLNNETNLISVLCE